MSRYCDGGTGLVCVCLFVKMRRRREDFVAAQRGYLRNRIDTGTGAEG